MINKIHQHSNEPSSSTPYVTLIEVFGEDFIGSTNNHNSDHLTHLTRCLLHGIHSTFPPPEVTNHPVEDPISKGKLSQGNGTWDPIKEILVWIIDGTKYTIQLTQKKANGICKTIRSILKQEKISLNNYQKISGKLQHSSFGMPEGRGLFGPIQKSMAGITSFIILKPSIKIFLNDWRSIVTQLSAQPTSVLQIVQELPSYVGYSDVCKLGAGGVCVSGMKNLTPFLWQLEWPQDVQYALISDTNPQGHIIINDLELAGLLLNWIALESTHLLLQLEHIGTFCDNTSTVSWAQNIILSASIAAGTLLLMLILLIHARKAYSITPLRVAGKNNEMADIVSQAIKEGKYFFRF